MELDFAIGFWILDFVQQHDFIMTPNYVIVSVKFYV